jgi:hypothetical protein
MLAADSGPSAKANTPLVAASRMDGIEVAAQLGAQDPQAIARRGDAVAHPPGVPLGRMDVESRGLIDGDEVGVLE